MLSSAPFPFLTANNSDKTEIQRMQVVRIHWPKAQTDDIYWGGVVTIKSEGVAQCFASSFSLVHTYDANANACANARIYTCELLQRKWKCKCKRRGMEWKTFHFLELVFAFAFAFASPTCEPGQRKCNWELKAKNTGSISVCHHGTIRKKMTSTSSTITEEKLGRA